MKHLFITCIATLLWACGVQPEVEVPVNTAQSFSQSYKIPEFVNDQRKARIVEIAPIIHDMIEKHTLEHHIPGMAYGIVVDEDLVVASATGKIDLKKDVTSNTNSSFRIASMTKSFTAMAILKLRDEGKLSLNDPVEHYVPEMAELHHLTSDAQKIDIESLLTMTAGFPEDNPWGDRQLDEPDQMLLDFISEGLSFSNTPSYKYEYSNLGYALLGNIVSKVSRQPYQTYIRENILVPLGMNSTYWEYGDIPPDQMALGYRWEDDQFKLEPILHDGSFGAMGGLITSIEDFSKYVSLHLSAWPARSDPDEGPVGRSTLREMHTPQFSRAYLDKDGNDESCAVVQGYGYGLGISRDCKGRTRVAHGGALPGYGSNYSFFPEYGIGIMAFGNLTYTNPWPTNEIIKLLFDSLALEPRQLPVSGILADRKEQVLQLIQSWEPGLDTALVAENFYLDKSKEHRRTQAQEVFDAAGPIELVGEIKPFNQLRGEFEMIAAKGVIKVFFTLTPEKVPKLQRLDVWFEEKKQ